MQDTEVQKAGQQNIEKQQYHVAINTLKSYENSLDIDQYFPKEGLGCVKNSVFYQMSRAFDQMLQTRLGELSHVSSRFLSSVIEESQTSL